MVNPKVVQALTIAFQFVNQTMADAAIEEMAIDLAHYSESSVVQALKRCRSELKTIRFSDIIDRIPGGHPGPEEAWAIVSKSMTDESATILWTDEIRSAYGVALALSDDPVAARMAFKEQYINRISEARQMNSQPNWSVSLGADKAGRELAIMEGVKQGRLKVEYAQKLLPHPEDPQTVKLLESLCPRLLS